MRRALDSIAVKVVALVVALTAVVVICVQLFTPAAQKTAVAYLPIAIHLYPGSEVDVLGVKVGTVRSVEPMGDRVKVVLAYDAHRSIPANAHVVVDEPTLVADRVVELDPPYGGGAALADGATIPLQRAAVPVELDELTHNLVDLADALGPKGANAGGALSRALTVGAANLHGEGARANTTIRRLGDLAGTLGDNRQALFATMRQLESFSSQLVRHDHETRAFTTDLATVSRQLADDSQAFSAALHNLGGALADITGFIRANRSELSQDVRGLAGVTRILARERVLLAHIADMGAVGISNYPHMYTPSARTYNARFDNVISDNPTLFFCQLYQSLGGKVCPVHGNPLKQLGILGHRTAKVTR